jgi:hypothetical protein
MTESEQLAAAQARIAELESRDRNNTINGAVSAALARHTFASQAAAEQARALIAADVDIVQGQVVSRDLRPVAQHVDEQLRTPQFAHFLRPRHDGTPAAAAPAALPEMPDPTLGAKAWIDAATARGRARAAASPNDGSDLSRPFGLTARRGA